MAARPEVSALTAALITADTGFPAASPNHKLSLTYALRTFRTFRATATNHFAVHQSLEGLEEKFRVRDQEALADELHSRLRQLEAAAAAAKSQTDNPDQTYRYTADVLSLLLELSDKPADNAETILEELATIVQTRAEEQAARERQIAEEDEAVRRQELDDGAEENIWLVPDFGGDGSSSDSDWAADEFTRQADLRERKKAAKRKAQTKAQKEEQLAENATSAVLDDYIRVAHAAATQGIELAQYWGQQTILPVDVARDFVSYGYTQQEIGELWLLGELHVIREVIFALYGLPSSLFRFQPDGSINVIARYVVDSTSPGSLNEVLDHFAGKAVILQKLRTFCKWLERRCDAAKTEPTSHDAVAPAQSFVDAIQAALHGWELESLVPTEEQYVRHSRERKQDVMVSLLQLQRELDPGLDRFTPLYEIVIALERGLARSSRGGLSEPAARVSFHLELLFKKTCEAESNGRGEIFRFLRGIFLPCLRTYLRPITKWMELGELREADGLGAFFVHTAGEDEDEDDGDSTETMGLARLWHGQYVLDRDERDTIVAPSFIRECGRKIFVTGKRKLGEDISGVGKDSGLAEMLEELITATDSTSNGGGRSLMSFNDALLVALSEWVDRRHRAVSGRLRDILYDECGLRDALEGMVDVYFMRDGFAATSFCGTLFERIERGHQRWSDRFLLTELLQSVYSESARVDITRLAVRSRLTGEAGRDARGSVKPLGMLAAEYRLSWPVMNVFTAGGAALERVRIGGGDRDRDRATEKIVLGVRWRLLTFVSLLQSYLVDLVLRPQVEGLRVRLAEAEDLEEMIDAQEEHFGRIEDLCGGFGSFIDSFIGSLLLIDIPSAIDGVVAGRGRGYIYGLAADRNVSFSRSTAWRRAAAGSDDEDESEDEEDNHENSEEEEEDDGGEKRREMLERVSRQARQLVVFLTTGLRSMARAGVHPDTIEVLAERLEMGD
ncbi:hypothetical protein DRE_07698 [Drechslerella stenobrocha 248]|uniref:Spindle pole body component n=1 Tax=Drechslerella stenobrocha 248 TaxID=1043628 RepID=W7HK69_9PEZI|nr:hypothetical protein DRE_07698 [Drechslerella stenobrocha 248]